MGFDIAHDFVSDHDRTVSVRLVRKYFLRAVVFCMLASHCLAGEAIVARVWTTILRLVAL